MASRLLALAERRLATTGPDLPVEMVHYGGSLAPLRSRTFDVVLVVDALRAYGAPRDSRHVEELTRQLADALRPGGILAMRFGPSWKSPYGGGVDSRLPWAQLIFPQVVIFDEFRRVRPGNRAAAFEDIGVNRVTLGRYRRAMAATGLQCLRFETNMTDRRALRPLMAGTRLPGLADFLTQNAYGIWRRAHPEETSHAAVGGKRHMVDDGA
jgi:SAM-dependent methyltransferase